MKVLTKFTKTQNQYRKTAHKLNTKVEDITKHLEKWDNVVTVHDLAINDLKAKQECVFTEITPVKTDPRW